MNEIPKAEIAAWAWSTENEHRCEFCGRGGRAVPAAAGRWCIELVHGPGCPEDAEPEPVVYDTTAWGLDM